MQEQNFKYLIVNQEIKTRKDYFTTIASGDYVTFVSDNTIFSIPFEYFFNKSDNEITKHFKGVLNNDAKEVEYDTFPLKRQHTNSKEQKEFMKAYNSLNSSNLLKREYPNLGDYLNKEQKVIEDWNKKDYNTTTVKVNCSPEDLVKLNTLRDGLLNSDFKPNSLEDIADLISAKEGIKETENKVNYEELDWDYIDSMAERMSKNLAKYPPKNWQKNIEVKELAKSAIRHARKILQEIDGDEETLQEHSTALGCNGMMINYQLKNK